jgi:hydroxylamine reductase
MLPCHAYPELKKYKHLVGNYGGAWQDQRRSSTQFPGAILMTTNCIQKPQGELQGPHLHQRAGGLAGRDAHRPDKDFTPVIEAALAAPGFAEDESPAKTIRRLRPQRRAERGRTR